MKCNLCDKAYPRKKEVKAHLMSVHGRSEAEAMASANIRQKFIPIIKEGEEIRFPAIDPAKLKPGNTCGLCSRKYSRREYLTTHLIGVHGKTDEEAKALTGLETKRNLVVPTKSKPGRKKKNPDISDADEDD
jgi:hypothetical protein